MITIDGIEFPDHGYDARGDVLYANTAGYSAGGLPPHACASDEGHGLEFDGDGRPIALTLVNVRWLIERDGELRITWPDGHVSHDPAGILQVPDSPVVDPPARDVLGRLGTSAPGA